MTERIAIADDRLSVFESARKDLTGLAYRMLGDMARAEDMVQEAWIRWQAQDGQADSPKALLVTIVTRLCLNELTSARVRREESRPDRLPEPVDLDDRGLLRIERQEQMSMAFLVLLQRLTAAERAVLLLHDVFDFAHEEIAALVGRNVTASRKMLQRARDSLATGRRMLTVRSDEHRRLLHAFLHAATRGDVDALTAMLADDAILVTDGGPQGLSVGRQRNLPRPLQGANRIAAFVAATTSRVADTLATEEHVLNGLPAIVLYAGDRPWAAVLLDVTDGRILSVFFHADAQRLRYLGRRVSSTHGVAGP